MDRSRDLDPEEVEKFIGSLSEYQPALPDELVRYHLSRAGFQTDDVRIVRLVALAAQKFVADVANDAVASSRLRAAPTGGSTRSKAAARDSKVSLTVDDLERALRDYGVNLRKPPYFADSVSAGVHEAVPPEKPAEKPGDKSATAGAKPGAAAGTAAGTAAVGGAAGGAAAAPAAAGGGSANKPPVVGGASAAAGAPGAGGASNAPAAPGAGAGGSSGQKPPTK